MTHAVLYPPANRNAQWFGEGNYRMPAIDKLLLHTTETSGWPGYRGGATAPTLTYKPDTHQWRQHFPLSGSARALQDPEGTPVRENRANVVQVEICCYCEPGKTPHVSKLDDQALDDLAEFAAFLHREWHLPLVKAPVWLPFPQSYGSHTAARMSSAEYAAYRGVLGHQHASGNSHGDPGAIDIDHILATAQRLAGQTTNSPDNPGPINEEDDMPSAKEVVDELLARKASNGKTINDLLVTTYNRAGVSNSQGTALQAMLRARDIDEAELARQLAAALPATGQPVSQAQLEAALRTVLGSVDEVN